MKALIEHQKAGRLDPLGLFHEHGGVVGDRSGVVFNGTVGGSYNLTEKLAVVGQYRYNIAKDVEVLKAGGKTEAYRASVISAGLRYTF